MDRDGGKTLSSKEDPDPEGEIGNERKKERTKDGDVKGALSPRRGGAGQEGEEETRQWGRWGSGLEEKAIVWILGKQMRGREAQDALLHMPQWGDQDKYFSPRSKARGGLGCYGETEARGCVPLSPVWGQIRAPKLGLQFWGEGGGGEC